MEMTFFKNGELKDKEIVEALKQAAIDYENGEVAEIRDLLVDIVQSINEFDDQFDKIMRKHG